MRIATKNEVLLIMGSCVPSFAAFCVSPLGAATKFLFDNSTSFDLDSELVQGMTAQLAASGIVDADCIARFTVFGIDVPPPAPRTYRYRVPAGLPYPEGSTGEPDASIPDYFIITTTTAIKGRQSL